MAGLKRIRSALNHSTISSWEPTRIIRHEDPAAQQTPLRCATQRVTNDNAFDIDEIKFRNQLSYLVHVVSINHSSHESDSPQHK